MAVSSFTPWLVYEAVLAQFKRISKANGFNLNPLVISHAGEDNEKASEIILVAPSNPYLNPVDDESGMGRVRIEQQILVNGYVFESTGDPRERQHALLQDALNAFFPRIQQIHDAAGAGLAITMQQVDTDENVLLRENEAAFEFMVAVQYIQGPNW